jgi:hypothetical protein
MSAVFFFFSPPEIVYDRGVRHFRFRGTLRPLKLPFVAFRDLSCPR